MKNILIIEPSTSGLELLPQAHAMGLRVFVFSANTDERIIPEKYKPFIFNLIVVDTNDFSLLQSKAMQLHSEFCLSAVIPGFELYVETTARLSHLLNLPGVSPETGHALRNKGAMCTALQQANVCVPRFSIIDKREQIPAAAEHVKFPCVIKPIDQSGSVYVLRLDTIEELSSAYHAMCHDSWTEMGKGIGSVAIIEEYIHGKEFSVEGYVDSQGSEIVSITEKFLGAEPYFVELGHIVQADIDNTTREHIQTYIREVIAAVQLSVGVFHCEIRLSSKGPVLMEISGRLAGDKICDLIFLSSGINLYEIMIRCHLGESISRMQSISHHFAGIHYFSSTKTHYQQCIGIDEIKALPGFHDFNLTIQANQLIPKLTSFQGRLGHCIFTAPSYAELRSRLNRANDLIQFI